MLDFEYNLHIGYNIIMKYILSIFAILISLMHVPDTYCATRYAQVMDETYLYRSSSTEHSATNIVCIMERSYFCTILVDYDANLFKVSYAGFEGYAKKADLKEVTSNSARYNY